MHLLIYRSLMSVLRKYQSLCIYLDNVFRCEVLLVYRVNKVVMYTISDIKHQRVFINKKSLQLFKKWMSP